MKINSLLLIISPLILANCASDPYTPEGQGDHKVGYLLGRSDAVKQDYWMVQNLQKGPKTPPPKITELPIAQINHAEDIVKWTQSIQSLNQQVQQMQQYIQLAQQVKGYIGDPAAAASAVQLQLLGPQMSESVGQLTSALNQTISGAQALQNSGSQLFSPIEFKTPSGFTMNFNGDQFKPFGAIQGQETNVGNVIKDTLSRIMALQQDKAATLTLIQSAPDQSTVQKLTAKINALDGQIAALGQQQQTATDQMVTQNIANQNDKEMKAQAANQSADHELKVSLQNVMQWEGQITSNRNPYQ